MPLPAIVANVAPLLPALMTATNYPRQDATLKYLNLALGIVVAGIDVEQKLAKLNDTVKAWAELGQDPPREWWAEYSMRSDAAHETIQSEAENRTKQIRPRRTRASAQRKPASKKASSKKS